MGWLMGWQFVKRDSISRGSTNIMDLWRTWLARSPEEREVGVRFLGDPPHLIRLRSPMAEAMRLERIQCEFESRRRYQV